MERFSWTRLKSMAGPEFARLNTGVRITRGNSGNGVLLTRENRAAREQKSGSGKTRLGASHPRPLYLAALRFVHNHLRRRLAHFELRVHFLGLGRLLVETRSKLRNRCAEVRCCSWSQREGRVSDRKTRMRCKRVVDHKIPSLASSLSQG